VSTWQAHAQALADDLAGRAILAPGWRDAFARTPRHVFVPVFYDGDARVSADAEAGLQRVYADQTLITQRMPHPDDPDTAVETSSSTQPSLMARMLTLLDATDGDNVLEIGTGTGYTAALLCHRLGDATITSVDIDPILSAARARLAGLGHRPFLAAADGTAGVPARAPFTRIIATTGVAAIPAAWITQLTHGGRIVAGIRGELACALLAADKTTSNCVRGRFIDIPCDDLMWLRTHADHPLRNGSAAVAEFDLSRSDKATTDDLPADAFDDRDFRFLLQFAVPGLGPIATKAPDGRAGIFLHDQHGSWLLYQPTGDCAGEIEYGGPQPLWPPIADLWRRWHHLNLPGINRLGMTCFDDGRWHLWFDHEYATVLYHRPNTE